jgi:anti-sigma factor ChrR (cupin superfamily)
LPDINADFREPAWLAPNEFQWVASPQGGVERVMLDRVGDEVAVATSLVRYAPDSWFPAHEHALGEEYLVLEGEFGDEHGRYPPGTYVRNPPGSRHTPFSEPGCVIWVKLRQFRPDDQTQKVETATLDMPERAYRIRELHRFEGEVVSALAVQRDAVVRFPAIDDVQELFVMEGSVLWGGRRLDARGWIRVPAGQGIEIRATAPSRLLHKVRPEFALP